MGVRTCRLLEVVEGLNRQSVRERVTAEHALDEAQGEEGSGTSSSGICRSCPLSLRGTRCQLVARLLGRRTPASQW